MMSGTPETKPSETPTSLVNTEAVETPIVETPAVETPAVETPAVETPAVVEPLTLESFKIPEGFEVDPEVSSKFLEILNDEKITSAERAQGLIDLQAGMMQKAFSASEQVFATQQETWVNEAKADSDVGGEKLAPALGRIATLVNQFGSPELKQVFDVTGAGNNVHMIKFLNKIASEFGEGGPVLGAPATSQASLAERMYPSMKKQGA